MAIPLSPIDTDRLKSLLSEFQAKHEQGASQPIDLPGRKREKAFRSAFQSLLTEAGLDVKRLDELAVQSRREMQRRVHTPRHQSAKDLARESTVRRPVKDLPVPFIPRSYPILRPFLIWLTPLSIPLTSDIVTLESFGQYFAASGKDETLTLSFYFLWQNPDNSEAVVNVNSKLILNGSCEAYSDWGLLGSEEVDINMSGSLSVFPLWEPPALGLPNPTPLAYQTIASLVADGWWFLKTGSASQGFSNWEVDLQHKLLEVAPNGVAVFVVSLAVSSTFADGNDSLGDSTIVDFADASQGYSVRCPYLIVDVLTAPSALI